MIKKLIALSEKGFVPDMFIRMGIRHLLGKRIEDLISDDQQLNVTNKDKFIKDMDTSPIALVPDLANEQHYEIPAEFYDLCLGNNKKYSSCFWEKNTNNLDEAEDVSLKLTAEHANLKDGLDILELGCGWGSLSLWMASRFPKASITSVSKGLY